MHTLKNALNTVQARRKNQPFISTSPFRIISLYNTSQLAAALMQGFFLIKALDDRFYATYRLVPWQISSEMDVRAFQLEEKLKSVTELFLCT